MHKTKIAMQTAKTTLKNKWHHVIAVFCIVAAALGVKLLFQSLVGMIFSQNLSSSASVLVATVITLVATALELFCFCPLYIGSLRWMWQTVAGADEPLDTLFYYYETKADYKKAIDIGFGFLWRIYGYFLICSLPFSVATWAKGLITNSGYFAKSVQNAVFMFWIILGVVGVILFIALIARHFLVLPVIFSDDKIDPFDAFCVSNAIAKGRVSSVLLMLLRFLPLILLCIFALPIVWVVPYFAASLLTYSRFSIVDYKMSAIRSQNPCENAE